MNKRSKSLGFFLFFANTLFNSMGFHVVSVLLPIYFTDSTASGGLGWSKSYAFSLYGTYISASYFSPLIGGMISDFISNKKVTILVGFIAMIAGMSMLFFSSPEAVIIYVLFFLAVGSGFVKAPVTAILGDMFPSDEKDRRHQAYRLYYIVRSSGFAVASILGGITYKYWGFYSTFTIAFVSVVVALIFFMASMFFIGCDYSKDAISERPDDDVAKSSVPFFFVLLSLSLVFYMCYSQTLMSVSVYIHEYVDTTLWGWDIPVLWFVALGTIVMLIIAPHVLRFWKNIDKTKPHTDLLKLGVGFIIGGVAFILLVVCIFMSIHTPSSSSIVLYVILYYSLMPIADMCLRPTLWSAVHACIPLKYRTTATALTYLCFGAGVKLGGEFAILSQKMPFQNFASIICVILVVIGVSLVAVRKTFFVASISAD